MDTSNPETQAAGNPMGPEATPARPAKHPIATLAFLLLALLTTWKTASNMLPESLRMPQTQRGAIYAYISWIAAQNDATAPPYLTKSPATYEIDSIQMTSTREAVAKAHAFLPLLPPTPNTPDQDTSNDHQTKTHNVRYVELPFNIYLHEQDALTGWKATGNDLTYTIATLNDIPWEARKNLTNDHIPTETRTVQGQLSLWMRFNLLMFIATLAWPWIGFAIFTEARIKSAQALISLLLLLLPYMIQAIASLTLYGAYLL